ncbi:hypothetical protein HDU98_003088, partial [Podochytrium sp. JEL0797]
MSGESDARIDLLEEQVVVFIAQVRTLTNSAKKHWKKMGDKSCLVHLNCTFTTDFSTCPNLAFLSITFDIDFSDFGAIKWSADRVCPNLKYLRIGNAVIESFNQMPQIQYLHCSGGQLARHRLFSIVFPSIRKTLQHLSLKDAEILHGVEENEEEPDEEE